ncbi:MAK10-like protein [Tanacetum coccineum]
MGDENHIRTLGDYSKPSHEGYKNTIELPVGNNVVPLRSDTIRLVQNGCSFHGLRSEDPNQHLKDFLKLVDSLDLDGENRERTRLRLFQFSLRDQASNWLERLPAGSITTWEDLTTRFLAQFFPPGRTTKLRNDIRYDILMFQPTSWRNLYTECMDFSISSVTRRTIDQSAGGKLRDRNAEESWALLQDLALYDNESWNDPRDFAKPVKAIALPQDVPSTSDRRLIELKNQVQRLMEAHLAPTQPTQVNKVTTSCKICSGPHDTQYCMKDPKQAFAEYASSRNHDMGNSPRNGSISTRSSNYQMKLENALDDFDSHQEKRLSHLRTQLEQQQDDMIGKINLLWKTVSEKLNDAHIPECAGDFMASENNALISHIEREELRIKGTKSPSKLFSPKYLSPASIIELNKNPSAPKRVHFINSIFILSKESEAEEGETTTDIIPKHGHNITKEAKGEVKEVMEEDESKLETDWEVKEILEKEEKDKDDTTSIIDCHLREMAFGRPFIEETGLVYNREEGTVGFKQNDEKITFKMPHTIEIFKQTRLMGLNTDSIPPSAYEENFGHRRTHYYQSLLIGDEYMQDEGDRRGIKHLMRLEREMMGDKEEVA